MTGLFGIAIVLVSGVLSALLHLIADVCSPPLFWTIGLWSGIFAAYFIF